jgi:hypothetical protein
MIGVPIFPPTIRTDLQTCSGKQHKVPVKTSEFWNKKSCYKIAPKTIAVKKTVSILRRTPPLARQPASRDTHNFHLL